MRTRYPRIREAYDGAALVDALDRVDSLAHSGDADSLIQLVLVQYLDILEAALRKDSETELMLERALEAVQEALDVYGLLEVEAEPDRLLN